MSRSKRVLWALAALSSALLAPSTALSVEQDYYIYRTLLGRVYFEYETGTREESGHTSETSGFKQTYSLDMKGNLLSRRLIIYDAGVSFTDEDSKIDSSITNSDQISYYLTTTILPLSYTPVTLYVKRTEDTSESSSTVTENFLTNYGMNFMLKFKRLPLTSFYVDRTDRDGTSTDQSTTNYRLSMDKDIGPTENSLIVTREENDDRTEDGTDSTSNSLNFSNRTLVSKDTTMTFGFVTSNSEGDEEDSDSELSALNLTLLSRPSQEFEQKHGFSAYSNQTGSSKTVGKLYDGGLNYKFNERLQSYLTLSFSETESESETSTTDSSSMGTSLGINYRLTENTNLTQTVLYSESDSTSTDPSATTSDYLLIKETTAVTHRRTLSRAMLSTSVGLSLLKEKSSTLDGTGAEGSASLGLSNIDINKYVGFNTAVSGSYIKGITGNMSGKTQDYSLSAFNKVLRKYVQMIASYKKYSQESWISTFENKYETIRLDLSSQFSRKLSFTLYAEHTNNFDASSGFSYLTTAGASGNLNQQLWGGQFDSGLSLSFSESKYSGDVQRLNYYRAYAKYNKYLSRIVLWRLTADSSENVEIDTDTFTRTTYLENAFLFPMRQWLMSVEHKYTITDSSTQDIVENQIFFKATRSFIRIF